MTKTAPPVPEAGVAAWLDRWSQLGDEVQDRAVGALLAGPSGGVLGVELPYQLYLMLPYAMAIVALVLVARRAAYPQALMKPYRKGER